MLGFLSFIGSILLGTFLWCLIGYIIVLVDYIIEKQEFLLESLIDTNVFHPIVIIGPLILPLLFLMSIVKIIKKNKKKVLWRSRSRCTEITLFGDKENDAKNPG